MASTLEKVAKERNDKKNSEGRINKTSCLKSDTEIKKLFGLNKDVRVCLKRIPDLLGSGEGLVSFSSLVKSDTYKVKAFTKVKEEEERKQQSFDKKRKARTSKKTMGHAKKRKNQSTPNTPVNGGTDATNSQLIGSVLPSSEVSHDSTLTSSNKTAREEEKTELEQYTHESKAKVSLNSNAVFEENHSFNLSYTEDIFPMTPPQLEETVRDEKIRRLKQALREKEAALEEMRKKMHQK